MKLMHCLSLFLLCAGLVRAHGWTVDSLPDPRTSPQACGRQAAGWTCSPDGLVDEGYLSIIEGYISSIYSGEYPFSKLVCDESADDVPVEVMALIVKEIEGAGDAAAKVAHFAKGIHSRFGVGDADCGSGVVVVIGVQDRQVLLGPSSQTLHPLPSKLEQLTDTYRQGRANTCVHIPRHTQCSASLNLCTLCQLGLLLW